jgi:hypothetical protein
LEVPYKPFKYFNRAVPNQRIVWRPVLSIKIVYKHAQSKKFDAIVDSGSDYCLFHASIGEGIGMKIKQGVEGGLGSVISGLRTKVWYHDVRLLIGPDGIDTKVGFSWDLDSNLLGQIGFFDNYAVTFNPIPNPPSFSFVRIEPN